MARDNHALEIEFERGKDTKNKQRFEEVTEDQPIIGTLYVIKKEADNLGENIKVTIQSI